jgi:hypothetical protein
MNSLLAGECLKMAQSVNLLPAALRRFWSEADVNFRWWHSNFIGSRHS